MMRQMRSILVVFAVIICSLNVAAKNYIKNDEITTDGWRVVSSIYNNLYTCWTSAAGISVVAAVPPEGEAKFFLRIAFNEGKLTMNEGSALLLKLGNEELIELKSNEVDPGDGEWVGNSVVGRIYNVHPMYEITGDPIQQIIDNDVVKIRVQYRGGTFDKDIKKGKLSKLLREAYPQIKAALSQNKTIYDDF